MGLKGLDTLASSVQARTFPLVSLSDMMNRGGGNSVCCLKKGVDRVGLV